MDRQVLDDGVNYEVAIGYHRFVLEIFLTFFTLSRESGIEFPRRHWERLEAMFRFSDHYLKPDGTAPLIGDSDDGRLLKFKERPAIDHSYLVSMAAVLFENEKFKRSNRLDEEVLWWFGQRGLETFEGLPINEPELESRAFADSQIFIQREGPLYAIIDCGDHGARGHGSHAHSDALSIEVFAYDRTFLRDPGAFVYTASELWRNRFRSTAYHNTVRVDGEEISQISQGELFALGPNVRPQVNRWETSRTRDLLDAEHYGYARLEDPVIHRRIVLFDKREGYWSIADCFKGEGRHEFEFLFNLDAGLVAIVGEKQRAVAVGTRSALAIIPASNLDLRAETATRWVSLSYGTRMRSSAIIYRLQSAVPFENVTLLIPYRLGEEKRVEPIMAKWARAAAEGKGWLVGQ